MNVNGRDREPSGGSLNDRGLFYDRGTIKVVAWACVIIVVSVALTGFINYEITRKAVVDKLTADIRTVVQSPTFQQKAQEQGATADYQTPAQLGDKVRADLANWATVVKTSKIEAE